MFYKLFKSKNLLKAKNNLIDEQTSPLFRIMSVYNHDDPQKRKFANNICAFHVGNGYILSVAHNLRMLTIPESIPQNEYEDSLIPNLNQEQINLFNRCYILDNQSNKRYLNKNNQSDSQQIVNTFNQINYDTRLITLYKKQICRPFLIIQFRENKFYNDESVIQKINSNNIFYEPSSFRHTFLIELELRESLPNEDFALYKIINTGSEVINKIPFAKIDYNIYEYTNKNFVCLQSAPVNNLGRLLNDAEIEGLLDHWNLFKDRFGGNYVMDGLRYLIKGYFRFGSSGAPYFIYDRRSKSFKVNAIQSEASPIQLSINNNREGNFQYINAIASPIKNIEKRLKELIDN